jgi:Zn finger protein HypA/HybF involved in hydrogenase expression
MRYVSSCSPGEATFQHGENKEPCSFHVKCYENWYLAKHGKQVAGDMSKIHRCPKCAQPKFKRKGGRALEEDSVADAEGEKKKAKAKL